MLHVLHPYGKLYSEEKRLKLQLLLFKYKNITKHTLLKHKPLHHTWGERKSTIIEARRALSEESSQSNSHLATIHYNSACLQGHMIVEGGF